MNIAFALKEKNRIAGRIVKLSQSVVKHNQWREDKTNDFNSRELLQQLQEERAKLVDIKTRIAKANFGIADKLVMLSEAKAELAFWNGFVSGAANDVIKERSFVNREYVELSVNGGYSITSKEVQENVERVQKLIEDTQDEIDNYNATTKI